MKLKLPQSIVFVAIRKISNIEMPQNIISSNFKNLLIFFFRNSYNNNMKSSPIKNFIQIKVAVVKNSTNNRRVIAQNLYPVFRIHQIDLRLNHIDCYALTNKICI